MRSIHSKSSRARGGSVYAGGNFLNIGGLKVRGPVKSAGVVVGRVTEIRFDTEAYKAVVSLDIDSAYQFPRDTSAKILTSGILGERDTARQLR